MSDGLKRVIARMAIRQALAADFDVDFATVQAELRAKDIRVSDEGDVDDAALRALVDDIRAKPGAARWRRGPDFHDELRQLVLGHGRSTASGSDDRAFYQAIRDEVSGRQQSGGERQDEGDPANEYEAIRREMRERQRRGY